METPEKRKVIRYSGSEILKNPDLLKTWKRVFVLRTIPGTNEKEGYMGVITGFNKETKTLYLSSYDGREKKEIEINEDIEIKFF
jgi:hypothetical protein